MARLLMAGAEIDVNDPYQRVAGLASNIADTMVATGGSAPTRNTATKRSGAASFKSDSTVSNSTSFMSSGLDIPAPGAATYWARTYLQFVNLPSTAAKVFVLGSFSARLTTAGKLQLWNDSAGTQVGSDSSATISADATTWYRIEISQTNDAAGTPNTTAGELRLDGVSVASVSGLSILGTLTQITSGWVTAPGASKVCYADDIAANDATGSANNSWCGDGKIILMKPSSDSQRGSWTGGVGGTTNLWDAVNNTPPIGTATETDASQIESIDGSGDNATDEYRGNCGSYTTAGIGASDTINAILTLVNDGEDVATGTKTGSFGCQSNPSQTYTTFTFGLDAGALGTYPTGWQWHAAPVLDAPSVTLGSNLIVAVRKTDSGTRVASVDFLGAYVDYTPAASGTTYTKAGHGVEHG